MLKFSELCVYEFECVCISFFRHFYCLWHYGRCLLANLVYISRLTMHRVYLHGCQPLFGLFSLLARFLKSETLQQHLRQFRGTRYQIKWKSLKKHTHTNGKEKILYFIDGWSSNFNTQNAYHRCLQNVRIM